MLLTITATCEPATDLGYLLHKHPDRLQSFAVSAGTAHVFYPEATPSRCTAALLLEVDPIALVRSGKHGHGELPQYVNDRPYAASSMLAVALKEAFRTALTGRCDARPELAATPIPLEIRVPALRCRGADGRTGADLAGRLFEPLGWAVTATTPPLDPTPCQPAGTAVRAGGSGLRPPAPPGNPPLWGDSPYVDLRLTGTVRLQDALNHLYVLLPALDDAKHYWVSNDEVDKLVRAGGDWLAGHPEKALITRQYLAHRKELTASALARLAETDDTEPEELDNAVTEEDESAQQPLAVQRRESILAVLREIGARTVGDFGCGGGALTGDLLAELSFEKIVATDVSVRALRLAARRLRLDRMPGQQRDRLSLFQSALTYRDVRLAGLDAAVLMEVIEHVDPPRLPALERNVFGFAAPETVLVTTPNAEYNRHFETLGDAQLRHRDHRFEWTRAEFRAWAGRVAGDYGYAARFRPIGPEHPDDGPPTQLAIFRREGVA